MIGLAFAGLVVFGGMLPANAACSNPSPLPSGYAVPCPVFFVSPASVAQTGTLALTATPQPGTDYIYTTAYYAKRSTWLPVQLSGNNAAPSYSTGPATGSLPSSILSTLPTGTNYVVLWDWLWDATAQCYKGPGLNQCNTGTWRVQQFNLTAGNAITCTVCVNAGGPQYTDTAGQVWGADNGYSGGSITQSINSISGTTDQLLYQSERYGMTQYAFTVPNGTYTVTLKFAEYNLTGSGQRVFNVIANGTTVLSNFDIYATTGGNNIALDRQFTVNVTNGQVLLQFNPVVALPKVDAIKIMVGAGTTYTYSQVAYAGYTYSQSAYTSGCTTGCNNYYVSTTGSDSNPGTQASPWKTINHACTTLALGSGGALVNVAGGTYPGGVNCTRSGTATQPLIWLSTSLWGAKITAAGSSVIWTQSGDYNTIQAFDISGDGNNNTVNGNLHGLILHGQFNHVLKNHVHNIDNPSCTSTNHVSSQGIDSDSVSGNFAIAGHNEISGNVIHDIGWPNTTVCNGSPAIYFGTPFGVAENNIIYRIGLSGIHMWHASTNMVVANNFMFQISAAANGTFVGYCILGGDGDTGAGIFDFSTIINNVCRDSQAIPLRLNGTTGPHNFTSKMLIFNMGSNNVSCTATDCTGFTNGVPPNNSIIASPLMVNFNANPGVPTVNANGQVVWPNADYHLQSGSPAINAGTTVCASGVANCVPSTDFSGKTRSAPIDIGAYEF